MSRERRTETRESLALPVSLAGDGCGLTRDLCASGLFLHTASEPPIGSVLDIEFRLDSPSTRYRFVARGSVVRVEKSGPGVGVAMKLHATRMEIVS